MALNGRSSRALPAFVYALLGRVTIGINLTADDNCRKGKPILPSSPRQNKGLLPSSRLIHRCSQRILILTTLNLLPLVNSLPAKLQRQSLQDVFFPISESSVQRVCVTCSTSDKVDYTLAINETQIRRHNSQYHNQPDAR
jgi:hypothetical protein